jgi:hypothetical protein
VPRESPRAPAQHLLQQEEHSFLPLLWHSDARGWRTCGAGGAFGAAGFDDDAGEPDEPPEGQHAPSAITRAQAACRRPPGRMDSTAVGGSLVVVRWIMGCAPRRSASGVTIRLRDAGEYKPSPAPSGFCCSTACKGFRGSKPRTRSRSTRRGRARGGGSVVSDRCDVVAKKNVRIPRSWTPRARRVRFEPQAVGQRRASKCPSFEGTKSRNSNGNIRPQV